ncbi:MAG: DUF255 domain-containing protein, partial [Candidatus Diapherotrites archaeon]|nr:DUF255 domain-containing protein [Candidatus Diapherotrites archaeon]
RSKSRIIFPSSCMKIIHQQLILKAFQTNSFCDALIETVKVNWLDWSTEAFEKARKENKLIFLSISAVWCHWCHRFDHDALEKPVVVKILNEKFVPIRVDTDKRPDINSRYNMGGWPSYAIIAPEKGITLAGGTYLPEQELLQVLEQTESFYKLQKSRIEESELVLAQTPKQKIEFNSEQLVQQCLGQIEKSFDQDFGGFGFQPKFPMPDILKFLLFRAENFSDKNSLKMLTKTLNAMQSSELFDKEEGGFFRYSTTREWSIPHYEKMLEDNSHLLEIYLEAYKLTKDEKYKQTAKRISDYLFANLFDEKNSVFFASQDADEEYYKLPLKKRKEVKKPFIDKTIFTDLNALLVPILLNAGIVLQNSEYQKTALKCLDFLIENLFNGRIVRHYLGTTAPENLLRDYSLLLNACLCAYSYIFDNTYLDKAKVLNEIILRKFLDKDFAFVDSAQETNQFGELSKPRRNGFENFIMVVNLLQLSFFSGTDTYRKTALQTFNSFLLDFPENEFPFWSSLSADVLKNGLSEINLSKLLPHAEMNKFLFYCNFFTVAKKSVLQKDFSAEVCKNNSCLPPVKDFLEFQKIFSY